MNNRMITATLAIISSMYMVSMIEAAERFQKLTGQQIQAKFAGMEFADETHWGEVLNRNGTLQIHSMGHKGSGKEKDQLCLDHGKEPGGGCYDVWLAGNKVEL
jgi:hypothetical protein